MCSIKRGFKFGDGDGSNLCGVKKVDFSSTFIENIFRSGLALVSSNDIISIKMYSRVLHIFVCLFIEKLHKRAKNRCYLNFGYR